MAKRKQKKGKVIQMLSPENYIKQKARNLPIHECWVNTGWEEDGLANITVARKHSNGNYTVGMYLADLKCLGIKDAQYLFNISPIEYRDLLDKTKENIDIETVNYTLVHNIIYACIEFAEDYGFSPHKDFLVAEYILEEDKEDIELIEIECGKDNKPLYVRGPLDSDKRAQQIIAQLEKTAGPGNYSFIDGLEYPLDDDFFDEDLDELTIEERLDLILGFVRKADKLTIDEADEMGDLIESTFIDLIDLDKVDEYYDNFIAKLDKIEIVENIPDEMFKDCDIPTDRLEAFKTDFYEVERNISEGENIAKGKLNAIIKKYSKNAALQYLEVFFLHTQESRKFDSLIEKSIQLYPNFPLIYLLWKIHELQQETKNSDTVVTPGIDLRNILDKVFPKRKKIYVSEMFYTILYLLLQVSQTLNMEQVEALEELILEVNLLEEDVELLDDFIKMVKMNFLVGLAERLRKENQIH